MKAVCASSEKNHSLVSPPRAHFNINTAARETNTANTKKTECWKPQEVKLQREKKEMLTELSAVFHGRPASETACMAKLKWSILTLETNVICCHLHKSIQNDLQPKGTRKYKTRSSRQYILYCISVYSLSCLHHY